MLMKVVGEGVCRKFVTIFTGRYYECEKLKRELEEQQKLKGL